MFAFSTVVHSLLEYNLSLCRKKQQCDQNAGKVSHTEHSYSLQHVPLRGNNRSGAPRMRRGGWAGDGRQQASLCVAVRAAAAAASDSVI